MREALVKTLETVAVLCILAVGFYPALGDAWSRQLSEKRILQYQNSLWEQVSDEELAQERERASAYNQRLAKAGGGIGALTEEEEREYEALLNIGGDGVMGYLEIPAISVRLPIYHGTSDEALAKGAGHLEGSSLPVGGAGTHALLSGHRGLPSASLFTDLDQLKDGDVFAIHVLGETHIYEVMRIQTVLPEETEGIRIEEGKDLVTLITCTPYGVNTHRLLVTGERSEKANREEAGAVTSEGGDPKEDRGNENTGAASGTHRWAIREPAVILGAAFLAVTAGMLRILWLWTVDLGRREGRRRRQTKRKVSAEWRSG